MRQVTASGVTDFFTGTAGSQLFEAPSVSGVDIVSEAPEKAFFTLSMTDGRSTGATVLFDRYEDKICATSGLSFGSDIALSQCDSNFPLDHNFRQKQRDMAIRFFWWTLRQSAAPVVG